MPDRQIAITGMHTLPLLLTMAALYVTQLRSQLTLRTSSPCQWQIQQIQPIDLEPVILTDGHRYFDRNGVPLTAPEPLIKKGTIEQYFTKSQTGSCTMASDFGSPQ